ncbi:MAG: hypothetical protein IPG42_23145 [Betaproteobacteria bacterium]|nr:hypothetical protein [Betaproteobacteria bacterium]
MKFPVSNASVSRNSYRHGDDFTLCLRFDSLETRGNHLESVTNVSVDLFRTERQRNQFAFGFGATPQIDGSALTITQKLTADLPVGLYVVSTITLCWNEHQHENVLVRFTPAFFAIVANGEADLDKDTLNLEIERVTEERRAYAQRQMFVPSALGAPTLQKFRVLIFGTGCILHAPQQLEGFAIVPLGRGFSYGRMLEIVNQTLKRGGIRQLSFDAQIEVQYEQATPAFMIEYSCHRSES